jgi:hypothetical protein
MKDRHEFGDLSDQYVREHLRVTEAWLSSSPFTLWVIESFLSDTCDFHSIDDLTHDVAFGLKIDALNSVTGHRVYGTTLYGTFNTQRGWGFVLIPSWWALSILLWPTTDL